MTKLILFVAGVDRNRQLTRRSFPSQAIELSPQFAVLDGAWSIVAWAPGGVALATADDACWTVWDTARRRPILVSAVDDDQLRGVAWALSATRVAVFGKRTATVGSFATVSSPPARPPPSQLGPLAALCTADRVYVLRRWRWEDVSLPVALARAPPVRFATVSSSANFVAVAAARGIAVVRLTNDRTVAMKKREAVELEVERRAIDAMWCGADDDLLAVLFEDEPAGSLLGVYVCRKHRRYRFMECFIMASFLGSSLRRILDAVKLPAAATVWHLLVGREGGIVMLLELTISGTSGDSKVRIQNQYELPSGGAEADAAFYSLPRTTLLVLDDNGALRMRSAKSSSSTWKPIGFDVRTVFCNDFHDETALVAYGGYPIGGRRALLQAGRMTWVWSCTWDEGDALLSTSEEADSVQEEDNGICLAATSQVRFSPLCQNAGDATAQLEGLVVVDPSDTLTAPCAEPGTIVVSVVEIDVA